MSYLSRIGVFFAQHIRKTLISGFLVAIPLIITYLMLKFIFDILDPLPQPLLERAFGLNIPGVGLIFMLLVFYVLGLIGNYVLGRRIIDFANSIVDLIPIVRPIYRTMRKTVKSLSLTDWEDRFSRVVLLDYPRPGIKSIGFVTATYKDNRQRPMVAVYIPTTPVPTSGFLALVHEDDVLSTTLTVDDAMKIVISGGVLTPERINTQ